MQPTSKNAVPETSHPKQDGDNRSCHCVSNKWVWSILIVAVLATILLLAMQYSPQHNGNDTHAHEVELKTYNSVHDTHVQDVELTTYTGVRVQEPCRRVGECMVTCWNITQGNPGEIAAAFIASDQSQCEGKRSIDFLSIENSKFINNTLNRDWLPLDRPITILELRNSGLRVIEDGAFSAVHSRGPNYSSRITITGFNTATLTKNTFQGVTGLRNLELRNNIYLSRVEAGILESLADTLGSFQLSQMESATEELIANFTNNAPLNSLEIVDLQFNLEISSISSDIFRGLTYVRSLYLSRMALKTIHSKTFQSIRSTIQLLDLSMNKLKTLPNGTFDGLPITSDSKYRFQVALGDNPWACDCSLLWLQEMMREYPDMVKDIPLCATPISDPQIPLIDAELCGQLGDRKPYDGIEKCTSDAGCRVECTDISDGNPGAVAASYIDSIQSQCDGEFELTIDNSNFPNNTLSPDWLPVQYMKILEIRNSNLRFIEDRAFANIQFRDPKYSSRLSLVNFNVKILTKNTFQGIKGLKLLELRNNVYLETIEANILEPLSQSLTSFQFMEMPEATETMIANFTNYEELSTLEIIDLRYNTYLSRLSSDIFRGLRYVRSVYLQATSLKSVDSQAFKSISRTIQLLHLDSNMLTTLCNGTLNGFMIMSTDRYMQFKITLANNPWHCDCSLLWLQEMMLEYPDMVMDIPICKTPVDGILLKDAILCGNVTTDPDTTTETITTTTNEPTTTEMTTKTTEMTTSTPAPVENGTITVECLDYKSKRVRNNTYLYLIAQRERPQLLKHPTRRLLAFLTFPRVDFFHIQETDDGIAIVDIGNLTGTLLRISDEDTIEYMNHTCITNATGSVQYKNVVPSRTYTFCLLIGDEKEASPYNCKALTTRPSLKKRTWLANEDKSVVLGVGITIMLLCGIICAAAVFLIIRYNPAILRGSKRVVVVQHRAADVIVLPKGLDKETNSSTSSIYRSRQSTIGTVSCGSGRTEYARNVSSDGSTATGRSSATSYVSAVEPTKQQLMQWRVDQMKAKVRTMFDGSKTDAREDVLKTSMDSFEYPPPLPPYPYSRESPDPYSRESTLSRIMLDKLEYCKEMNPSGEAL